MRCETTPFPNSRQTTRTHLTISHPNGGRKYAGNAPQRNSEHEEYACRDGNIVNPPHRATRKSGPETQITVPRNGVWYARDAWMEVSSV